MSHMELRRQNARGTDVRVSWYECQHCGYGPVEASTALLCPYCGERLMPTTIVGTVPVYNGDDDT